MTSLRPGFVLADRYRLDRMLGSGGSSVVWAAEHVVTHRVVALKIMTNRGPDYAARFLREARIATRLAHPSVVAVHDVFELDDDTLVMAMDLLEGVSLATRLREGGPLSPREVAQVGLAVASALMVARSEGVVHRDLKPENIFLTSAEIRRDTVRVLDFGVAKWMPGPGNEGSTLATTTGALVGTPHYMSPEQVFGESDVDARSDLWSLGAVLFECATGRRTFAGDNYGQVFKAITIDEVPVLEASTQVPEAIALLVNRLLSRDRKRRLSLERVIESCEAIDSDGSPTPKGRFWAAVGVVAVGLTGIAIAIGSMSAKPTLTSSEPSITTAVSDAGASPRNDEPEAAVVLALAPTADAGGSIPRAKAPSERRNQIPDASLPGRVHAASPY